jgi:hypothetical protein
VGNFLFQPGVPEERRVGSERGSLKQAFAGAQLLAITACATASSLLADPELPNHIPVTVRGVRLQVIQKTTATAHHHEQSAAGRKVLFVGLEMLRQLIDATTQDRNLNFGAAGIAVMRTILINNFCLLLSR